MPAALERKLAHEASSRGYKGRRAAHFVYGIMNKIGAMRGNKITAKGRRMERRTLAEGG